jgi:hypothetical protein
MGLIMRYTEEETTVLAGKMTPGLSATIKLVDMKLNELMPLTSDICIESPIAGMYLWDTANVNVPAEDTHVLYCMTASDNTKAYGKVILGGDFVGKTDIGIVNNTVVQGNEDLRAIIEDVQLGNWKIDNRQMIMYTKSGEELARFDLFDFQGNKTSVNVAERVRVDI